MRRLGLLQIVMATAATLLIFKVAGFVTGVASLQAVAIAQEQAAEPAANDPSSSAGEDAASGAAESAGDLLLDPAIMSRTEMDLIQNLADRRRKLDEREAEIDTRESLLAATERRIDSKIAELQTYEVKIKDLLAQYATEENSKFARIVKTYETMKPKDAASILESLDMEIKIQIAIRMKESKIAPILAAMTPEKARELTIEMATMNDLDDIDG